MEAADEITGGAHLVIGCIDTAEGRFLLNLISNFYVLPYIDLGVTIETVDDGEITEVTGYLHYLQPGRSSFLSRAAISLENVRAEGMKRQNARYYQQQRRAGYIKRVCVSLPSIAR